MPIRRLTATALLTVLFSGASSLAATAAWAHHPAVAAAVRCDTASLVVSAWDGEPNRPDAPNAYAGSRTNPGVAVALSVNGGPYQRLPQQEGWRFTSPGYAFTAAVPVPREARAVSFQVTTVAPWANGTPPGDSRATPAVPVPACDQPPVAVADSGAERAANPSVAPRTPTAGTTASSASATAGAGGPGGTSPSAAAGGPSAASSGQDGAARSQPSTATRVLTWVAGALLVAAIVRLLYNLLLRRRRIRQA